MQSSHQHSHSQHGCGAQSRGPEVFYGYCHETRSYEDDGLHRLRE